MKSDIEEQKEAKEKADELIKKFSSCGLSEDLAIKSAIVCVKEKIQSVNHSREINSTMFRMLNLNKKEGCEISESAYHSYYYEWCQSHIDELNRVLDALKK